MKPVTTFFHLGFRLSAVFQRGPEGNESAAAVALKDERPLPATLLRPRAVELAIMLG